MLKYAKANYDLTYARAWDEKYFDGGLFWRVDNQSKNSCVTSIRQEIGPRDIISFFMFIS